MEVKMKNSREKYNYNSPLKSSASSSLRLYFYTTCFMFLSFRLVTSLTGVALANSAAGDGRELSKSSVFTSIDPNNINALELMRTDISIAYGKNVTEGKDQLKKLIEQIRSVEFESQKAVQGPVIVPEQPEVIEPNKTEPNEIVPDVLQQIETAKQQTGPKPPDKPIADETLQMLKNLAQEPRKVAHPLELGEVLFISGNLKEAVLFYNEALKRTDPNDAGMSLDRAWILFQIGNCLQNDDMPAAAKMYQRLLTEYPNSPWVDFAAARNNLIAWYMKDEPMKLIQQLKPAGTKQQ